jgi:GNAT superfamily N-acetyltransferase
LTVRQVRGDADLRYAADLHERALGHGFFVSLGTRFLGRYWRTFAEGPRGVALVATADGAPVGALCGTTANRAHFAWALRHHGLVLAFWGVLGLLRRPALGWHFLRTRAFRYVRNLLRLGRNLVGRPVEVGGGDENVSPDERRDRDAGAPSAPVAVLVHMMVEPDARGSGVGRALVSAFVERAREDGATEARLVTLDGDRGAEGFYARVGWDVDRELPADAVREDRIAMRRDLEPGSGDVANRGEVGR